MKNKFLNDAVRNGTVMVYFQPIIDNKTLQIYKFEALARLKYEGIVIMPDVFLKHSKKTKTYEFISKKILMAVFVQLRQKKEMRVSINVSMSDMSNSEYIKLFFSELKTINNPNRITIEIVESERIDYNKILYFLKLLQEACVEISLDDFGSGYANFISLTKINYDYIKIDGSIIKNIALKQNVAVVEFVKSFSRDNGIKVVAEFVENADIYKKVIDIGIDYSQGFFIGKPTEIHSLAIVS